MTVCADAIEAIGNTPLIRLRRASAATGCEILGNVEFVDPGGAVRLARELGPGHTIVTVLADRGQRHASRLFNPDFLSSKGLTAPKWLQRAPATTLRTPLA